MIIIKYLVKALDAYISTKVCDPCVIFDMHCLLRIDSMPLDMAPGWDKRSIYRMILILKFLV